MIISLPNTTEMAKPIQSLAKSLSKTFDIKKSRDLEKTVELATYLYASGSVEDSIALLESFVFDITYDDSSYSWGHKCDGLALLAYVYEQNKEADKKVKPIAEMSSKNFDKNDLGWLIDDASDDIEYDESDREVYDDIKNELSSKERLMGHYSKIVKFAYYYLMLGQYCESEAKTLIEDSNKIVTRELEELNLLLSS